MSEQTSTENVEQSTERPQRKVRRGYVVSDKMDKTVVVLVEERYKHSLYGKVLRRAQRGRHRRSRLHHGDPPAERHQAFPPPGDPRARQVTLG